MKLENKNTYRPNEAIIRENEENWGVKLPEEFCQLLKMFNGGVPEKRNFQFGKRTRMIERL